MPARKVKDPCPGWLRGGILINTGMRSTTKVPFDLYVCPSCGRGVGMKGTGRARDHQRGTRAQKMAADLAYRDLRGEGVRVRSGGG